MNLPLFGDEKIRATPCSTYFLFTTFILMHSANTNNTEEKFSHQIICNMKTIRNVPFIIAAVLVGCAKSPGTHQHATGPSVTIEKPVPFGKDYANPSAENEIMVTETTIEPAKATHTAKKENAVKEFRIGPGQTAALNTTDMAVTEVYPVPITESDYIDDAPASIASPHWMQTKSEILRLVGTFEGECDSISFLGAGNKYEHWEPNTVVDLNYGKLRAVGKLEAPYRRRNSTFITRFAIDIALVQDGQRQTPVKVAMEESTTPVANSFVLSGPATGEIKDVGNNINIISGAGEASSIEQWASERRTVVLTNENTYETHAEPVANFSYGTRLRSGKMRADITNMENYYRLYWKVYFYPDFKIDPASRRLTGTLKYKAELYDSEAAGIHYNY